MKKEYYSYIMMLGHLCADISAFAMMAMLPFLVSYTGLSYTSVSFLVFLMSLVNAVTQPFFGAMADKKNRMWLMSLGVFLSGCGVSVIGWLDNYYLMMAAVVISSLGGAIYHPDAGRMANYVAGKTKGKGVSNFSFGGNLSGFVGPSLTVFGISVFGLHGTLILAVPALIMSVWLLILTPKFKQFAEEGQKEISNAVSRGQNDDWGGFLRLAGIAMVRSAAMFSLTTFIPLFWLSELQQTEEVSGMITTLIAISGAAATLIGGRIADRVGFNKVILVGMLAAVPFMAIMAYTRSVTLSAIMLVLASLALYLTYSPTVVLGQKLVPNHIGFASGITMGLASSAGGIVSPILGRIGDNSGMGVVLWIMVGISVLAAISLCLMPQDPDRRKKKNAAAV